MILELTQAWLVIKKVENIPGHISGHNPIIILDESWAS